MYNKKTIRDVELEGKRVLYRSPYDINIIEKDGRLEVIDDSRLQATLPTLNYLLGKNCKIGIVTYVKRPDGQVVEKWRTEPIARRLSEIINLPVKTVRDCLGKEVQQAVMSLKGGEILMLENTRFHKEEMVDDDDFARELSKPFEVIVQDGFPQIHRIHASITGIARHLPAVMGFYLEKEITELNKLLKSPERPFLVIIGGAKISDKIDAISNLISIADKILVGGGVANNFVKAAGYKVGNSYLEDVYVDKAKKKKKDFLKLAKELLRKYPERIILPKDFVACDNIENPQRCQVINLETEEIKEDLGFADLGPKTIAAYSEIINTAETVFWNGPLGVFEVKELSHGTKAITEAVANCPGKTIIGGGDTIVAIRRFSSEDKFTYISLAGGATLEFLAGKNLPGIEVLQDK